MSLKSADEPGLDHGDYIEFVMLDGTKRVPCRVSQEAIDDIEGGKPPPQERMERFNRHRARIEDIARQSYEAGQASFDVRPQNLGVERRSPMETLIILLALATVAVPALTEFAAARSLEEGE